MTKNQFWRGSKKIGFFSLGQTQEMSHVCTCPVKLSSPGSCTKDIHYVAWLARGGGIPELQISAAAKYEVDADAPPLPQPLKFVPIKNIKTGVVHNAAFIAKPPRRI